MKKANAYLYPLDEQKIVVVKSQSVMKLLDNHYHHRYVAVNMYHSAYERSNRGKKPKDTTRGGISIEVDI